MSSEEKRVYRRDLAIPVGAFDVLQDLKRAWRLRTNSDVLTRLLLTQGPQCLHLKHEDDDASIASNAAR